MPYFEETNMTVFDIADKLSARKQRSAHEIRGLFSKVTVPDLRCRGHASEHVAVRHAQSWYGVRSLCMIADPIKAS